MGAGWRRRAAEEGAAAAERKQEAKPLETVFGFAYTVGVVFLLIRVLRRRADRATSEAVAAQSTPGGFDLPFGLGRFEPSTPLQRREAALKRAEEEAARPLPEPAEAYKGAAAAFFFGLGVLLAAGRATDAINAMPPSDTYVLRNATEALKLIASGGLYLTGFLCVFTGLGIGAFGLQVQFNPDEVMEQRKAAAERKAGEVARLAAAATEAAAASPESGKGEEAAPPKKVNPWASREGGMASLNTSTTSRTSARNAGGDAWSGNLALGRRDDGPISPSSSSSAGKQSDDDNK